MDAGVTLTNIAKSFGRTKVLDDVCLDVRSGEFISLVGPSGCGKSTLLRIIAGLELQDAGSVEIAGRAVDHTRPRERNVAMVFQNYALYPHLTVAENIATPLMMAQLNLVERLPALHHLSPRRRRIMTGIEAAVRAVADQLQITALLTRRPAQLSGGQRQRVALARAMVRRPTAFLMDEPLSNLDAKLRVHMRGELIDLHRRLGATFIYVTHDQVEAMTMSTRVALMDGGRILQLGTPTQLYDSPNCLAAAQFIGSPAINVLPAALSSSGDVQLFGRGLPLRTSVGVPGPVSLGLRPESLQLGAAARPNAITLPVRLHRVEHHGAERIVTMRPDANPDLVLTARLSEAAAGQLPSTPGYPVEAHLDMARAHLFDATGRRLELLRRVAAPALLHA